MKDMTDRCKDPATDTWPVRSKRGWSFLLWQQAPAPLPWGMALLRPHGFGDAGPEEIPATSRWGEAACRDRTKSPSRGMQISRLRKNDESLEKKM